jgi:hypothetical protein
VPAPHLQAVFSRPVIALGSDWGSKELQDDLVSLPGACARSQLHAQQLWACCQRAAPAGSQR